MIVMNPNWTRWCIVSVRKFFDTRKGNLVIFYTTKQVKDKLSSWAELRMDGPYTKEYSTEMELTFVVNVLVTADYDNPDQNLIFKRVGLIESIFVNDIPVFKFGDGTDDDQSQLGCLTREMAIRTTHYGQFDKNVPLTQSVVEANYSIRLR